MAALRVGRPGCCESGDSQARPPYLAQTVQGVRNVDWDVVARVHESSGVRLEPRMDSRRNC